MRHLRFMGGHGYGGGDERSRYATPWLVMSVVPIPAVLLHSIAGGVMTVVLVAMLLLATGLVGYSSWVGLAKRGRETQLHVTGTIAALGSWLSLSTITGFITLKTVPVATFSIPWFALQHPAFEIWLIGGIAAAAIWNIRSGNRSATLREHEVGLVPDERELDPWRAAGFEGIKIRLSPVNQWREEGVVELPQGNTVVDLQSRARTIESAHGWAPSSVQFLPAPEFSNARMARIVRMKGNPLEVSPVWPGLQIRRGMTLFDPVPIGVRSNGDLAYGRSLEKSGGLHRLIMGMTGSGKTFGCRPEFLYRAALGADLIVIDTVKSTQSFRSIANVLQMYEINEGRARNVIEQLIRRTLPARTEFLARRGLTEWQPNCGLRFLFVHIEEAWALCDMEEVTYLALALRSAGGQLTLSLQRGSGDQLPSTLRSQLAVRQCYGVMEPDDMYYALSDNVVDALGQGPADWGNQTPGMQIIQQGGSPMAEQARPVRSFTDEGAPTTFAEAAAVVGRKMHDMCEVTAASLGTLWDGRVTPLDLVAQRGPVAVDWQPTRAVDGFVVPPVALVPSGSPMTMTASARVPAVVAAAATMTTSEGDDAVLRTAGSSNDDGDPERELDDALERGAAITDALMERAVMGSVDRDGGNPFDVEVPRRPADRAEVVFGGEVPRSSDDDFAARMNARLDEVLAAGSGACVSPTDFTGVVIELGRSIADVLETFRRWTTEGGGYRLAQRGDGTYVAGSGSSGGAVGR